jgi:hypothetical protein
MKVLLMHPDRDFEPAARPPAHEQELTQDLELGTLLAAMAAGDRFVLDTVRTALLASLTDPDPIVYRQQILADCLEHPEMARALYAVAVDAIEGKKHAYFFMFRASPDSILGNSVSVMDLFLGMLRRLRAVADQYAGAVRSPGLTRLFAMLADQLDDTYLKRVEEQLRELRFKHGTLASAGLGRGNKGTGFVLRRQPQQGWRERIGIARAGYSFQIPERDQAGAQAQCELRGRGINPAANVLAQSADHVLGFFEMLRVELAFYIGALNLHEALAGKGEPTCFPVPAAPGEPVLSARGLYDVCLTLNLDGRAVGNDVDADGQRLVMITGANQGGKSTFLRSVGLAQLMTQCGLFAPADRLRADLREGVFTHFTREEDAAMQSGKLDEELARMSVIADRITGGGLLLCNESFASTNEREGSQIARQIVGALTGAGVKVVFVTHLYDLAHGLYREQQGGALFLRAERRSDGRRTFKLAEGEPLPTSYGEDLYRRVFAEDPEAAQADART